MDLLLKNGYVVDSASGFEGKADILIHDNRIREVGEDISAPEAQTVDCAGLTVIQGICTCISATPDRPTRKISSPAEMRRRLAV